MTAYEYLVDLATEIAAERAISQKERKIIKNLLIELPLWTDEKIANLATSTVETVKLVRVELQK